MLVLGVGVLAFAALGLAALGYRTASLSRSATAPAGSDAAAGNALITRYFPRSAASPSNLVFRYATPVWQHPGTLASASSSLASSGLFASAAGPLDPNGTSLTPDAYAFAHRTLGNPARLPLTEPAGLQVPASTYDAYRASAQYVSADGRTARFAAQLRAGDQQSTAAMDATPAVCAAVAAAARVSGATASGITGQAAALYDVSSAANADITRIIPVAALAIAILLGLVLRSLVAPVYLVVSIVASYLAALGATTLLVIGLGGQDGLVFILPFLMSGTFGVLALAGGGVMGGQLQSIGLGLAVGVLLDTFGVRTLLVPSAVVLLGRWNWWPSRLSRRPLA